MIFNKNILIGSWESETLEKIPDYQSNFTNWVECVLSKGKLIIDIKMAEPKKIISTVKVPVIFMGGGSGHFSLYSCDSSLSETKITLHTGGLKDKIIPIRIIAKNKTVIRLFDLEIIFHKTS